MKLKSPVVFFRQFPKILKICRKGTNLQDKVENQNFEQRQANQSEKSKKSINNQTLKQRRLRTNKN